MVARQNLQTRLAVPAAVREITRKGHHGYRARPATRYHARHDALLHEGAGRLGPMVRSGKRHR